MPSSRETKVVEPQRRKVLGQTEPRIFTQPLRKLTPETSDGFAAIAFAEKMLGMRLFPWQEWLLIHALELYPDGTYRFRIIVIMVARQNGKTMVEIVLALWHLYALKSRRIIGTAQSLEKAEDAWLEAVVMAQEDEELAELIPDDGIYMGHPKKFVVLHDDARCEYRIAAASRRGGRGFSGDLILLDELREHQNWESWSSVTNTMNARPLAQTWAFTNAGDITGVVLRYQRALAHREMGWPDDDELEQSDILEDVTEMPELDGLDELPYETGFFEWSMPPRVSRTNIEWLAVANPSCNHDEVTPNCITLRALLYGVTHAPASEAEAEICCRMTTMGTGGPFPEGSWDDTSSETAAPPEGAQSAVCVEVSAKRDQAYIARAALMEDGTPVVGIWQDRAGTEWIIPFLLEHRNEYDTIIIRTVVGSPVMSLYDKLIEVVDEEDLELPVVQWKGVDLGAATGKTFDHLRDRRFAHLPHRGLDTAATSAESVQQPQGGWVIDIKNSPADTAPLLAAIGAVWGTEHLADEVSVYATEDVFRVKG